MPAIIRESAYEHHDNCEKMVYVNWINRNLFNIPSLSSYVPINPRSEEIFDQINDGVIYCETINEIFPNSIDVTVLMLGSQTPKEERIKNLQLAFETSRSYGCQIDNLRVNDVFSGVRQSVLELFWQIFYIGLVVPINIENFPDLSILKESGEPKETIKQMKPEDILVRYINYQMRICDPFCKGFKSFKENLNDGYIYSTLIDSIAQQQDIPLKHLSSIIIKEKNDKVRNEMLFENFDCMRIHGFLIEELMNSQCSDAACYKMHILTLAIIFHKFGLLSPFKSSNTSSQYDTSNEKDKKESNIQKLCRIFLNFITVKPLVTNLPTDCKDGLIFAQVMKLFSPELFKKDDLIEDFEDEQVESKRIHNAAIIKNRFGKFLSLPIRDFHPEYIQAGKDKVICGIVYNLMLYWSMNITKSGNDTVDENGKKFSEKELLIWVNSISDDYKVYSFRDSQIHEKNVFAKAVNNIFPKSIDWCYLKELPNRRDRAIYCINVARREGVPIFIHPEMLASGDYRSTMLAFSILKEKAPKPNKHICPE